MRHRLQFKNLKSALKLVNYALFYDNSKKGLDVVATYFDKSLHLYKAVPWLSELLKFNTLKTEISDDTNKERIQELLDELRDLVPDELLNKPKK